MFNICCGSCLPVREIQKVKAILIWESNVGSTEKDDQ